MLFFDRKGGKNAKKLYNKRIFKKFRNEIAKEGKAIKKMNIKK